MYKNQSHLPPLPVDFNAASMIAMFMLILIVVFFLAKCILNLVEDRRNIEELRMKYANTHPSSEVEVEMVETARNMSQLSSE